MQTLEVLRPREDIHCYLLGQDSLLFDEPSRRLFHLNSTASAVWKGLASCCTKEEIVRALVDATGGLSVQIDKDVGDLICQWRTDGLLSDVRKPEEVPGIVNTPGSFPRLFLDAETFPERAYGTHELQFRIVDTSIRLRVPSKEVLQCVQTILAHFVMPGAADTEVELIILHKDPRYLLLRNGELLDWCEGKDGIAPMVHGNCVMLAYDLSNCFVGIHGAAIRYEQKSILMPGAAGCGKSTLTAAMMASGFDYCADELVLLSYPPIRMRPVPTAIGLKTGSWKAIEVFHPQVVSLTTHCRLDGKSIRYLLPSADFSQYLGSEEMPVDYMVMPYFDETCGETFTKRISAGKALCRIAEAGYDVSGSLTADKIGQLVQWIADIPCYELHFAHLRNGIDAVKRLLL